MGQYFIDRGVAEFEKHFGFRNTHDGINWEVGPDGFWIGFQKTF